MKLQNLADLSFADRDPAEIESNLITIAEGILGRKLARADLLRLFLLGLESVIIQQREIIDQSAKMNLLAYAVGDYLDHIGILVGCERLKPAAANTTVRYTLSIAREQATLIPAGNRVTAGDGVYFATTETLSIPAGQTTGDVAATCTVEGAQGNNYAVGELNKIVDPLPFVSSVTNITATAGGDDREEDDSYRLRIQQAPESYSCAGSKGAYIFWTKTASALISDVAVISPEPCKVNVYPLLEGGQLPGAEMLAIVSNTLNARTVRPLTDQVAVLAPTVKSYNVNLTYYIDSDDATSAVAIQAAVQNAVSEFVAWQKERLGRDINPTELYYRVREAGAKRAAITEPVFATVAASEVAIENTVTVNFGGLEDG